MNLFLLCFAFSVFGKTYDVLSIHKAEAIYEGIEHIPCHFRTSLCPDRCGHAKNVAKFKILNYLAYEKKGHYGDEKQENFMIDINPNATVDRQDEDILQIIKSLAVGDKVEIYWEHIYVNEHGSMYPERPVRSITLI